MKKKLALFLAVCIAAVSLTACAGGTQPVDDPQASSSQTETSEAQSEGSASGESQNDAQSGGGSASSENASSDGASDSGSKSESSNGSSSSDPASKSSTPSQSSSQSSTHQSGNSSQASTSQQSGGSASQSSTASSQSSSVSQSSKPQQSSSTQTQQTSKVTEQSTQTQQSSTSSQSSQSTSASDSEYDIGGIALYNELFNINSKVTVEISVSDAELKKLQADYNKYHGDDKKSDIYRKANVTFFVNSKKYTLEEVGIRLKGNQSLDPITASNGKPNLCSYKLSFDETFDDKTDYGSDAKNWNDNDRKARKKRKFASMNGLDIKWNISYDNTNIREVYATKLFESADVLVQKIGLSQLKFNGNNHGLVKIYEPIDTTFLRKRLPESAIGGDLYKAMWSNRTSSKGTTGWRGATYKSDNSYGVQDNKTGLKFNFNLKTNKKTSTHAQLKKFLAVINKGDPTKAEIESVLDVDYYARFMAASYFAGDPDDIRNNYNNHYLYFRKDNGKAIFIVYDNDRTLGITYGLNKNCATRNPYSSYAASAGEQENPLIKKTISHNPTANLSYIRDKYTAALNSLSKTAMLTSDADFNKMYNTAKSNYESIITPYTRFDNQDETFRFDLSGNQNGGDRQNMSFEQFRSQIMNTFKTAKP